MDERQVITIPLEAGDALRVSLASEEEISRMSDLRAIERIDELRDAARTAAGMGLEVEARTMYANACDIVEHNLLVPETIGEYADMLESQGLEEPAAEYRAWHEEFTDMLAQYDLPAKGYEERQRAEVAQERLDPKMAPPTTGASRPRERLGDAVAEAEAASRSLGETPSHRHLTLVEGRGAQ